MDRDSGIRRTRVVTLGLAGASLAGVVAVGALAAQHATAATTNSTSTTTNNSTTNTNTTSTNTGTSPALTRGDSGGAAATSGGS